MTLPTPPKSGFEKWQEGINKATGDAKWNFWDCEVQLAVNEYNHHLAGTAGNIPLDWRLIKTMLWVESGANSTEWNSRPMQIGVVGDPGLTALLSGKEGGDLILPPAWKARLTAGSARSIPAHNLRAGIGYLLMRMANFEYRSVTGPDTRTYEVSVNTGDSFGKIASTHGTTVDILKTLNPQISVLHPGTVLNYRKASVERVITHWRQISTSSIAQRYNGGGDPNYEKKLDYALSLVRKAEVATCAQ